MRACLGRAAVDPVGVGVWRGAAGRIFVWGDVQRVSLRDAAGRERLSPDRRKGRQRRSVHLGDQNTDTHISQYDAILIVSVPCRDREVET